VVIGNRVEKNYDRLIKRLNGRIVGVLKNDVKLINGNICDRKLYEVTLHEYLTLVVPKGSHLRA
jgi:hypothetical protein